MNPIKRDFMLKILAMRLFIGERDIATANNLEHALKIDAIGKGRVGKIRCIH